MKTCLSILLASVVLQSAASAQSCLLHEWISNDQRRIHARFVGVGASSVLIEKDGSVFHVPFARLAPESIAQARSLGRLDDTKKALATKAVRQTPPDAPKAPAMPVTRVVSKMPAPAALAKPVLHRPPSLPPVKPAASAMPCLLSLNGKTATATTEVPYTIQRAIEAGNYLQTKPYVWGGGHGSVMDRGYDCSGSVSYVLIQAGLLNRPLTSSSFARYGLPGPGKYISIHAGPGHVFMTLCGLRLDTGGRGGRGESGPRWSSTARYGSQWTVRHPPGW
ncbi:MAG: hypothetical protein IAE77_05290 [Prosthecobacter sp.]|uniref:hypothetical protein n=1 Tax=Prosthecobacter sp. TaxID=1965333 RepID=UPI001A00229D|nr:hypothetical protein [Prosthecobacter sp.]MBE2282857.1 hypothetical protein [Prosthecobacter sp.]